MSAIARDGGEVGFSRLIGLRAARHPIPQSSKTDSESRGKFLLGRPEGTGSRKVEKPGWRIRPAVIWRDVCAFWTGAQTCQTTARLRHPRLFFMGSRGPKAHGDRLRIENSAPAEVPSGWLTPLALDDGGIIGYNRRVRLGKALRACRVRYARKSSSVFVCSSSLWFPPFVESRSRGVKLSRSG